MVPWGVQRNKRETLAQTYEKQNMRREIKKWLRGNFYLIVEKYVIILLLKFIEKQFLNVMFEGVYISTYFILAGRLIHVSGLR